MPVIESPSLLASITKSTRRARHLPALLRRLPVFDDPLRFARYEVSEVPRALPHRLRGSGLIVYVRHHTADIGMLNAGFVEDAYRFPAPVWDRLTSLRHPPRVLDAGAKVGMFGLYVLERFPDARILALEPDPLNAVILRRCIRANGRLDEWLVDDSAAPDALELLPHHDLAKLSLEDEEWRILEDERLAAIDVPLLFVEGPAAREPDPAAIQRRRELLRAAGFSGLWSGPRGPGHGVSWAWRN